MAETELYYYQGCTSCRNAEALLNELGVGFAKHEYFMQRFTASGLKDLLDRIGLTPRDVLSQRSRPYKDLDLANRNLDDGELIALMIDHPQLLKRPITVRGDRAVVGYKRNEIAALVDGVN